MTDVSGQRLHRFILHCLGVCRRRLRFVFIRFIVIVKVIIGVAAIVDNKLEDEYRMKDEGSSDGEKVLGVTGGKFIFSKKGQGEGSQH